MALFGKKNKPEGEKKEGFFSRFRKKKEQEPEAAPKTVSEEQEPEEDRQPAQQEERQPAQQEEVTPLQPEKEEMGEARFEPEPEAEPEQEVVSEPDTSEPTPEQEAPVKKSFFQKLKGGSEDKQPESQEEESEGEKKRGFFTKLKDGLKKTRESLKGRLNTIFLSTRKIDEDLLEEIEEMLIGSDLGVQTTMDIIDAIRLQVDRKTLKNGEELKEAIKVEMLRILEEIPNQGIDLDKGPTVILIVGVNGVGKTTTIGKLANQFRKQGKSVVVCAADTFRAAAVEQLQVWAGRAGVDIVLKEGSKDPASVVFDALERVKETNADVLLVDTAGRLHNNPNLMNELEKIRRITTRSYPDAPHNVLLILDAVTGQNGLQQAKQFVAKVGVTDLIVTKMDGTAKGGIAIAIAKELNMPIQFVGVGEQMDDLLPFDSTAFINSLFEG